MQQRLQKYLSDCGVASRRKAEQLILEGMVSVNGEVITTLGYKVDDKAEVMYKGELLKKPQALVYIMLNKPRGYVTTAKDQFGRLTVMDLIKDIDVRLFPVGRLDYNTSGLLLLTNDGELSYKLTHPKHNIEKVYIARIKGVPSEAEQRLFCGGMVIDDKTGRKTAPAKMSVLKSDEEEVHSELCAGFAADSCMVRIAIREGRNRQVRKMLEQIGHNVITLERIATGHLTLGKLESGKYRHLTSDEVEYLQNCYTDPI